MGTGWSARPAASTPSTPPSSERRESSDPGTRRPLRARYRPAGVARRGPGRPGRAGASASRPWSAAPGDGRCRHRGGRGHRAPGHDQAADVRRLGARRTASSSRPGPRCPGDTAHHGYQVYSYLVPAGRVAHRRELQDGASPAVGSGTSPTACLLRGGQHRRVHRPDRGPARRVRLDPAHAGGPVPDGAHTATWNGGIACADIRRRGHRLLELPASSSRPTPPIPAASPGRSWTRVRSRRRSRWVSGSGSASWWWPPGPPPTPAPPAPSSDGVLGLRVRRSARRRPRPGSGDPDPTVAPGSPRRTRWGRRSDDGPQSRDGHHRARRSAGRGGDDRPRRQLVDTKARGRPGVPRPHPGERPGRRRRLRPGRALPGHPGRARRSGRPSSPSSPPRPGSPTSTTSGSPAS